MTDVILYQVVTTGGGVDGLDHKDKGGEVAHVGFEKQPLTLKYGNDARYSIVPSVIDLEVAKREALAKLNKVDRLVLFGPSGRPSEPAKTR